MDMFNMDQQDGQQTRAVPAVSENGGEVRSSRRRRTERFAGLIDEQDAAPQAEAPAKKTELPQAELPKEASSAGQTQAVPAVPDQGTRVTPVLRKDEAPAFSRTSRVPTQVPSQGVPRPAALSGQQPHREREQTGSVPTVRRPVNAEGYAPLQQLGAQERERTSSPWLQAEMAARNEAPRRVRTPETERIAYEPQPQPQAEEKGSGRGLIAVIILLLIAAAMILGLLMIPEEDTGVLGNIKRAVTEPIRGLFGEDEEKEADVPATATDFTATVSQATAPYKVVFHIVTSSNVRAVRVVDSVGMGIPTVTTLSAPNSETTIVWMVEMTLEKAYEGTVQAQIQTGDSWIDTGLFQTLSLGGATPPTVSSAPAMTEAATPTQAPTQAPVQETATPEPELTPAPATDAPTQEPPLATATPTLSVTATPTVPAPATPTAMPEAASTEEAALVEEPLPEATATPTLEPTATPSAVPEATAKLEAAAVESADPSLITETVIYKDERKVTSYEREVPMNMPAGDDYLSRPFGVMTYRGNAFRQNAAVDTVENPTSLALAWTVEAGSVAGSSRNYYGIGWTGQAAIVRWPSDIRASMELDQARKDQKNLKEVIVAGLDGTIYFLDLTDGTATREAIDFGYPMRGTPSVHPLFYPVMTVGQYARKLKSGTSDNIGLYYYNMMNRKQLRMIDGIDRKLERPYNGVGAFDTSALIDRTTNTLIAIGTNGLLYTEKLDMNMHPDEETGTMTFKFDDPAETVTMMSHTKGQRESYAAVESSLAMYANYAYYADLGGVLRCVDTTTMTTAWAVETGDAVRAAIALDLEEGENSNTLWLYTANLVNNGRTRGDVTVRRYNAMTGEEDWAFAINCADTKKQDVTFNAVVTPGAMASPVIGQNGLEELVYFTLSSVSAAGAQKLSGDAAIPGVIIAFNKATGEVVWHKAMEAYCYSSPVAVYDEAGKGWIIQACSNGTIYLMDGLTGDVVNTLQVNGVIEGSPAVYGDMMVIGTTGKDTSYIYGIKIN